MNWVWKQIKKGWFLGLILIFTVLFFVWRIINIKQKKDLEKALEDSKRLRAELLSSIQREERRKESSAQKDQEISEAHKRYEELLEKEEERIRKIEDDIVSQDMPELVETLKEKLRRLQ
jgi:flagellar biosynthesis/type III secretory pathway M-ring protein FliF/YscJ